MADPAHVPPHAILDALPAEAARAALHACCGSARWVDGMLDRRPFGSTPALFAAADSVWSELGPDDFLEAFAHHPEIGGELATHREKYARFAEQSAREQAGVASADEATRLALCDGNRAYKERFGYVFIVCATGKSAREMLDLLEARLANDPAKELSVAAGEQAKITRIRLEKLAR